MKIALIVIWGFFFWLLIVPAWLTGITKMYIWIYEKLSELPVYMRLIVWALLILLTGPILLIMTPILLIIGIVEMLKAWKNRKISGDDTQCYKRYGVGVHPLCIQLENEILRYRQHPILLKTTEFGKFGLILIGKPIKLNDKRDIEVDRIKYFFSEGERIFCGNHGIDEVFYGLFKEAWILQECANMFGYDSALFETVERSITEYLREETIAYKRAEYESMKAREEYLRQNPNVEEYYNQAAYPYTTHSHTGRRNILIKGVRGWYYSDGYSFDFSNIRGSLDSWERAEDCA